MPACITPFTVKNKRDQSQPVPCGKCINCRKKRISHWSLRLMQESKVSTSSYFITLTYDSEHCPITRNGFMELRKKHVQDFFKRFRYYLSDMVRYKDNPSIKYFIAGEYGGVTRRPHYHVLLFNSPLELIIGARHANMVKSRVLNLDGETPFKCDTWGHGHITIGDVSGASVGYTTKYMMKDWKPMHRNDDRQPQFSLMSKGLGLSYLTPAMINWHKNDLVNRMYCKIEDGKKVSMPRYYKEKLFKSIFDDEIERYRMQKDIGITVRYRMIEELQKKVAKDKNYDWNKLQSDIQSFDKLAYEVRMQNMYEI